MTKEELKKYVDHEIQWLQYYGDRESRNQLTIDSSIYETLISIGYTKRVVPLYIRCSAATLTADKKYQKKLV